MEQINSGRRKFLIRTGWIAAGVTVLSSCSNLIPILPNSDLPKISAGETWIQLLPSGKIRFLCPRAEMGQGASIGLTQVVASELNVLPEDIECVLPSTDEIMPVMLTVGSESISEFFIPTAHGAAALCQLLKQRAAEQLGVEMSDIDMVTGANSAFVTGSGKKINYKDLVSDEAVVVEHYEDKESIQMGGSALAKKHLKENRKLQWNRTELIDIVTGRMKYSRDATVEDMLYGQVLKAPPFSHSVVSIDLSPIQSRSGVVLADVNKAKDQIYIVCESPFVLAEIVKDLQVQWNGSDLLQQEKLDDIMNVNSYVKDDDFEHTLFEVKSLDKLSKSDTMVVNSRYTTPTAAHAAIEPRSAVVHYTKDKTTVWGASQGTHFVRDRVARVVGQDSQNVVVHAHRLGGAFGGRILCQAAEEAALLSKLVGKAVRVQWSREDEFLHNSVQPQFDHMIEASVSIDGHLMDWKQYFTTGPIIFTSAVLPSYLQSIVDFTQEDGSPRCALPLYTIPNALIRYSDIRTSIVTSAWRGLGALPNTFAKESMIDELAVSINMDPLAFRLKNLGPDVQRLAGAFKAVGKLSGWGGEISPHHGMGIAGTIYKQTAVAVVAEVYVDPENNHIKVTRVWCAQDCGLVINPDQVTALVEGNIVWGISAALKENLSVKDGQFEFDNFDRYPIARMSDTPEIKVEMIEIEGEPPVGAGEPACVPTPAAIANAIFSATGNRLRDLPLSMSDTL